MTALLADQARTLRQLEAIWKGRPFILVGATAIGCWMTMGWRATADVDLAVACDLDEFPCGLAQLPGWTPGHAEHRWHSPDGVRLDILPAGAALLDAGSITWRSGSVMQLTGFRLAFEKAVRRDDLAPDLVVHVPPLEVLVLLKMASFQDRPREREHDLDDLVHVLRHGIALDARVTKATVDAEIDFDLAGAFLLGRRLRSIVSPGDALVVERFLQGLLGDRSPTLDRMQAAQVRRDQDTDAEDIADNLVHLWKAYTQGFA